MADTPTIRKKKGQVPRSGAKRKVADSQQKSATKMLREVQALLKRYDGGLKRVDPAKTPKWTAYRG